MLTPYTERQIALIVKNVVAACKDINNLNNTGYKFINLASGFIAHYNLNGFIGYYSGHQESLFNDILDNQRFNQWNNFNTNDENYSYYMSKKVVYNRIVEELMQ